MKKEDYYEDQIVVSVNKDGERKSSLFTVVEVHDSHIVLMSPWYGLDAIFYENSRVIYAPATPTEIQRVVDGQNEAIAKAQAEIDHLTRERAKYKKALDALNR